VVKHYIRSKSFVADVVAVLPLKIPCSMFDICDDRTLALLKFNQLVKFYKVIPRTCHKVLLQCSV